MADDCDEGWRWEGEEGVGGYGVGEGAEVFLAVLGMRSVSACGRREGLKEDVHRRRNAV